MAEDSVIPESSIRQEVDLLGPNFFRETQAVISKRTLEIIEQSAANFKSGLVSAPVDLSEFSKD